MSSTILLGNNLLHMSPVMTKPVYHKDPKFSDRQARANSVDPDQTAIPSALFGPITL